MELWFATGNPGKAKEVSTVFSDFPFEIKTLKDIPSYTAPEETGETFKDNANLKAQALKKIKTDAWILADDSGLIVDGLKGYPGVHSARYAGENARDIENVSKVLKMLSIRSNNMRTAKLVCTMTLISPDGNESVFTGSLEGEISKDMRGSSGFGYDPIFIPKGETRTLGEMNASEKNKISHRSQALAQVINHLKNNIS